MAIDASRASVAPLTGSARRQSSTTRDARVGALSWERAIGRRLWITDGIILLVTVFGTQFFWFSSLHTSLVAMPEKTEGTVLDYGLVSALLVIVWMGMLAFVDSRSVRVLGSGITEYQLVVSATLRVFSLVAIIALFARVPLARGYLLLIFPIAGVLLIAGRWLWRVWLVRRRDRGEYRQRVLLIGSSTSVAQTREELERLPSAGYQVVALCETDGIPGAVVDEDDRPSASHLLSRVGRQIDDERIDTVVVTGADSLSPSVVKRLSWSLEAGRQHLVLSAGIADIAGPRLHVRRVAGLPLIHVETPRLSRGQLLLKRLGDLALSTIILVVGSPLLLALAVGIAVTSRGPILFRQRRIGRDGRPFTMYKFRSMVDGAADMLPSLLDRDRESGNEVLFKMRNDPRVTRVGRWMRRYSLDELPQLFNVLRGDMSLVGPRPPLPSEVARYAKHVHRRFLVKPGITGLWQVNGRSSLSWTESVRLDLSYVENYSLAGDLLILAKTVKVVVAPGDSAW